MWFTPPDVGITVLCVFVNGDRSQGFYIGTAPDQSIGHMVPAIGAAPVATQVIAENENQAVYFKGAEQLPVVEINTNNLAFEENSRFFAAPKPIQSVVAETMFRQGLIKDSQRGPISSSSQRESPSAVFGVSTPGPAVYRGGMQLGEIQKKIQAGELKPKDLVPAATAITFLGEDAGNKISSILGPIEAGLKWKDVKADVWEVNFSGSPASANNPYGGGAAKLLGFLTGGGDAAKPGENPGVPPDPYKDGPYANKILGPVTVIDQTKARDRGITFKHDISLVFEYSARSIGGVNSKAAMLDTLNPICLSIH